jgi:hypothetical protein
METNKQKRLDKNLSSVDFILLLRKLNIIKQHHVVQFTRGIHRILYEEEN